MLLLDTKKPISLDEIARRIGGFPDSPSARHQAFERAKKELRELGIPIVTHQIPGEEQYGYQIDRAEMMLPDLRFTDEEASSLAAASALVSFGGGERESALQKLGCVVSGRDATVANIPNQPALFPLFEAMGSQKVVNFSYRSRPRSVDIFGISFRWGNWYLLGNERESGMIKTFLVSRIESEVEISDADSIDKPKEFDISSKLPKNRWEVGEGGTVAVKMLAHPDVAPILTFELGKESVVELGEDGAAEFSIEIVDSGSFFDWLLSHFDKVTLIEPPSLVKEFANHLENLLAEPQDQDQDAVLAMVEVDRESDSTPFFEAVADRKGAVQSLPHAQSGAGGDLRSATAMYSALVKILPWLARKKTTTVAEISKSFGISAPEVVRLMEIAACCGLPPYTPDSLLEIIVEDDGSVESFLDMEIITAPRKLSTTEAMVLATTAAAALKVPGLDRGGHLASALKKLQASLSRFDIALSDVDVGIEEPYFLPELREAVGQRRAVEITYFSSSSERVSTRRVEPYQLFNESGRWYMRGFCHLAAGVRHFSVGRIISCEFTGSTFELPRSEQERIASGNIPKAFGGTGVWVILAVPAGSAWLVERLAESPQFLGRHGEYDLCGLRSSSSGWISRLLVRLPPSSFIASPVELRPLRRQAIESLLALYA